MQLQNSSFCGSSLVYFDILLLLEGIGLVKQPFWQPPKQLRWEHFEIWSSVSRWKLCESDEGWDRRNSRLCWSCLRINVSCCLHSVICVTAVVLCHPSQKHALLDGVHSVAGTASLVVHQYVIFISTLHSRCRHYILILCFLLLRCCSFFARLISAVANLMSTILPHLVWP